MTAATEIKKEQGRAPLGGRRQTPRPWWRCALEFLLVILACIAGLETTFALGGIGEQEYLQPDPVAGFVIMPGRSITFRREGFSRAHFNSLGMADRERSRQKPVNTYRIAVLGDSIIEALQVERSETMCSLLEKSLNQCSRGKQIEVLNFAVGAYNIGQMYTRLRSRVLAFQPDLVVLFIRHHSTYDVIPQAKECFPKASRPYFFVGEGGTLIEDHQIMNHWAAGSEGRRLRACSWLREHSHIWGALSKVIEQAAGCFKQIASGAAHWGADVSTKQTAFAPTQEAPAQSASAGSQATAPAPNPEAAFTQVSNGENCIRCYYPVVKALIAAMSRDCSKSGANFALAYMPTHDSAADLEHKLTRNTAAELKIPYLDLGDDIARARAESTEPLYIVCHFSRKGNAILAKAMTAKISELPCLKDIVR